MWIYKELEKRLCRCLYILFLTAASFADFCIFSVPPPSLGIVSVPCNWRHIHWLSTTYICRFYILRRKVDSAWESKISFVFNQRLIETIMIMKKQILLLMMMMLSIVASADTVEINGIYYNLYTDNNVAVVTRNHNK